MNTTKELLKKKIKQCEEKYQDNEMDWEQLKKDIESSSWTEEDEKRNERELEEIQRMKELGQFLVVCKGILSEPTD